MIWKILLYLQSACCLILMGIYYFFVSKLIFWSYKNENQQNPFLFFLAFLIPMGILYALFSW